MSSLVVSLRALASPMSVMSLVLLVLNDHWLKTTWPSWFTGKLSDVVGLVVAPLLLTVLLDVARLPRALPVAMAATGAGFVFCKTSEFGAEATSSVWSMFGTPTMIRADLTDLVAMPALYVAWRVHRSAVAAASDGWRRVVAVAVGAALLPVGVLATSATSCQRDIGVIDVEALEGRFSGTGARAFFVVKDDRLVPFAKVHPRTGVASEFPMGDYRRVLGTSERGSVACDSAGMNCWRAEGREVEMSRNGGVTWTSDLMVSADEQASSVEGIDPGCGDGPSADMGGVAVLDTGIGSTVAVGARHAGLWLRLTDGGWRLVPRNDLEVEAVPGTDDGEDVAGPLRGVLRVVQVPPARSVQGWSPQPTEPTLPCASPTTRTVTPNPMNGPPTSYAACP
jgi:hypothetical protein